MAPPPPPASIFPRPSLLRSETNWADYLQELTPVQRVGELTFKREDTFAPMGYGGLNGAKLRQLVYLVARYREAGGDRGLLTGASVLSPQLPMAAAVARHFDLPSLLVLGSTNPEAAARNEMVRMAAWFGARFDYHSRIAYNPILQNRCRQLLADRYAGHFYLEYGITCDHRCHDGRDVLAFHNVGARQVANIPDYVTDLVIPAGSCNSCTSILHGLVQNPKPNLRNIHLIGIGPTKMSLIDARLRIFAELTGKDYGVFEPHFESDLPTFHGNRLLFGGGPALYNLYYEDLHGRGVVEYHKPQPYSYEGIEFHPTYEGKVMNYLFRDRPELIRPTTLVWIIGSKPNDAVMAPLLNRHCGPCPVTAPEGT